MAEKIKKLCATAADRIADMIDTRYFVRIELSKLICITSSGPVSNSELSSMSDSMAKDGLVVPISVVGPYCDGTYKVVDGTRRVQILKEKPDDSKLSWIPCYVVDGPVSDKQIQLLSLNVNRTLRRSKIAVNMCYAKLLAEDYKSGDIEKSDFLAMLSELSGMTDRSARNYCDIVLLGTEEVQEAVINGKLDIWYATLICKYANSKETQHIMAVACAKTNVPRGVKSDNVKQIIRSGILLGMSEEDAITYIAGLQKKSPSELADEQLLKLLEGDFPKWKVKNTLSLCQQILEKYQYSAKG